MRRVRRASAAISTFELDSELSMVGHYGDGRWLLALSGAGSLYVSNSGGSEVRRRLR